MLNPAFFQTLAQVDQLSGSDMLIRLFLFFLVGTIFFVLGFLSQQRKRGKGKWAKYVFGLIPVIAAIVYSMDFFHFANDSFAKGAGILNDSRQNLFRASPFLCVIVAVLMIVGGMVLDRRAASQSEDIL